jgi:anti-sigma28 factor (negative regulator of flagellin synthesis)
MRVYEQNLTGAATGEAGRLSESQKTERAGNSAVAAQGGDADRVEFSATLGSLSRAISADQNARSSRIVTLTDQVQSGTYRPDAAAISRGMVSEALSGA